MSEHQQFAPGEPIRDRMLIKTGVLWASAIGLVTLIVVSLGLMRAFDLALSQGDPRITSEHVRQQLSIIKRMAPLDPDQQAQRQKYDRQQAELLDNYSWVDQKQHLARIPIERAMAIIVDQYGKAQ